MSDTRELISYLITIVPQGTLFADELTWLAHMEQFLEVEQHKSVISILQEQVRYYVREQSDGSQWQQDVLAAMNQWEEKHP